MQDVEPLLSGDRPKPAEVEMSDDVRSVMQEQRLGRKRAREEQAAAAAAKQADKQAKAEAKLMEM